MKTIELLAPAKDLECGMAAIGCGADAVYIGAPQFGAREAAGNSIEDISALVSFAHKYWAKVHVTLNTLLYDEEIPQALGLIAELYEIGIDGLIIQDTGLLECDLPPLPIIASTQMHNNTPEKVAFLEKVGIQRVILARELDLDQIRAIREHTGIELECFIHGSLCVSYSGQCYLSYGLGRRSGNRGQCAQPCRKPYTLVDAGGNALARDKHLLSIRDLNLSSHLRELIRAGVCSFKIEGRLKEKTYVSNVVAYYRRKLDEVLAEEGLRKSSSGATQLDFEPNPDKTFNRGCGTYFLHGKGQPVGSIETPKMVGETMGTVISVTNQEVTVDSTTPMHRGDGICFFDKNGELRGTVINDVRNGAFVPDKPDGIEIGTRIHRNHDHEFLTRLNKSRATRQIGVTMALRESATGFVLVAEDEDGNKAEFSNTCEKIPAEKPDQALVNIQKQLMKSGGADFLCSGVEVDLPQARFIPISTLNALRRGVLENLAVVRLKNRPRRTGEILKNDASYPEKTLWYLGNVLNYMADAFYRRHGVTRIEPAAESGMSMHGRKVMTTRYCVKHQLGLCSKDGDVARHPEPLYLLDAEGNRLRLRFNCGKCEMEVYLEPKDASDRRPRHTNSG